MKYGFGWYCGVPDAPRSYVCACRVRFGNRGFSVPGRDISWVWSAEVRDRHVGPLLHGRSHQLAQRGQILGVRDFETVERNDLRGLDLADPWCG